MPWPEPRPGPPSFTACRRWLDSQMPPWLANSIADRGQPSLGGRARAADDLVADIQAWQSFLVGVAAEVVDQAVQQFGHSGTPFESAIVRAMCHSRRRWLAQAIALRREEKRPCMPLRQVAASTGHPPHADFDPANPLGREIFVAGEPQHEFGQQVGRAIDVVERDRSRTGLCM